MDIASYIQRSKRTLDDIFETVRNMERTLEDVKQRNRFLEQSNVDLNADITRFRLQVIELKAQLERQSKPVAPTPVIDATGEMVRGYADASFHI